MTRMGNFMPKIEERQGITGFFWAASAPQASPAPENKTTLDPQNPFGSLTAGKNQFTVLWDTNHGDPSIPATVANNVSAMAASGVKHIILEYPPNPESQAFLDRFFRGSPQPSESYAILNSHLFQSASASNDSEAERGGLAYASLIIEARRHGMTVHLGGDEAGYDSFHQHDAIKEEESLYLQENETIHRIYEYTLKDPSLLEGLDPERREHLQKRLLEHGEALLDFEWRREGLFEKSTQERLRVEAQTARAERFVQMAQGEKAVVLWGQNHYGKLDVALDYRLRQDALKTGAQTPEPTRGMDLYVSRANKAMFEPDGRQDQAPAQYYYMEKELDAEGIKAPVHTASSPVMAPSATKAGFAP